MRKIEYISVAVIAAVTLSMTSAASSKDRIVIKRGDDPAKVKVVEKKSPYIGIYMDDLNEKLIKDLDYPEAGGVWVMSVIEGSPAEKAGLEDDDIIYMFDGEKVQKSVDIGKILKSREAGDTLAMVVFRDGKKKEMKIELGEYARQYYTIDINNDRSCGDEIAMPSWSMGLDNYRGAIDLFRGMTGNGLCIGVRIHDMDADLAGYFGVDGGVLVLDVLEDTPAGKAGMKSGDIIVEAAGEKIVDTEDLLDALRETDRSEDKMDVVVIRKDERRIFAFDYDDLADRTARLWISPEESDFKHFKLTVPEIRELDLEEQEEGVRDSEIELDKLRMEIETLEKRLKKLENDKD